MLTQVLNARPLVTLTLSLSVSFLLAGSPRATGQSDRGSRSPSVGADAEKIAEAGAMFQKNCISCHQPPDLKFATDRAWLDQLNRTA